MGKGFTHQSEDEGEHEGRDEVVRDECYFLFFDLLASLGEEAHLAAKPRGVARWLQSLGVTTHHLAEKPCATKPGCGSSLMQQDPLFEQPFYL